MDFAALPPEINSARIYAGPGAAPMMAAAAAWNALSAELATTAASCESVISALTSETWRGPASATMAVAAAPYVDWISTTAAAAEQAAAQATASAAAFEAAFAMTVPPPLIVANRSQLALLVATNLLGQNTAAIAATEANYAAMWAQDAAAMYGYAGASASAGVLQPLSSPISAGNPAGPAGQAGAVTQASASGTQSALSQLISGLPGAVQTLASPLTDPAGFLSDFIDSTGASGAWNGLQQVSGAAGNIASWNLFAAIAAGVGLAQAHGAGIGGIEAAAGTALIDAVAPVAPGSTAVAGGKSVLVGVGQAAPVGGLSVPPAWAAATPAPAAAELAGSGWTAAVEDGAALEAIPAGMPAAGTGRRGGFGYGTPHYGVKPVVMPRSTVVG